MPVPGGGNGTLAKDYYRCDSDDGAQIFDDETRKALVDFGGVQRTITSAEPKGNS